MCMCVFFCNHWCECVILCNVCERVCLRSSVRSVCVRLCVILCVWYRAVCVQLCVCRCVRAVFWCVFVCWQYYGVCVIKSSVCADLYMLKSLRGNVAQEWAVKFMFVHSVFVCACVKMANSRRVLLTWRPSLSLMVQKLIFCHQDKLGTTLLTMVNCNRDVQQPVIK